jgi:hypothetical protein
MNCKPGDLAIVIGSSKYSGRLVEVLFLAPNATFVLPNGQYHRVPDDNESWVVNILGSPIEAQFGGGVKKPVMQGVAADKRLRPLPGKLEDEEIEDELTVS